MTDLPFFSAAKAREAREEAIDRVDRGATLDFKAKAMRAIQYLCRVHGEINTDMIWAMLGDVECREPRAMGAVMRRAQHMDLIKGTDRYKKSEKVENHRRPIRIWKVI